MPMLFPVELPDAAYFARQVPAAARANATETIRRVLRVFIEGACLQSRRVAIEGR